MIAEKIILERVQSSQCPICGDPLELDYQAIIHPKYGRIRLCRGHYVDPHILEECAHE